MKFRDGDVKDGSKFFEGVFEGTITSSKIKINNGNGNWSVSEEANPYNENSVWEIGVKIGEGKPQFLSLFGGEPFEGRQHKWATLLKNCGLDPNNAYHDQVVGHTIKVLAYAEKPTAEGNVWSRYWNATFDTSLSNEQIEGWFKSMLDSAGEKNRVKKTINPESKWVKGEEVKAPVPQEEATYAVPHRETDVDDSKEDDPF